MKKKYVFIALTAGIIIVILLGCRSLTKVMPADSLYTQCERNGDKVSIHCVATTAFDRYKNCTVTFDDGKAYIKANYYLCWFLRSKESGDFTVSIDVKKENVKEIFLTDSDGKPVKVFDAGEKSLKR